MRQAEGVLRVVFVEIGVINAHPLFIILFSYKNQVGKALWVIHLFDKAGS
jgi:hypothetical protein